MIDEAIFDEKIRLKAYALWQAAGEPDGGSEHFWHQAKLEVADENYTLSKGAEGTA